MTREQMNQEAEELQKSIDKAKEMYYKGEINHSCYWARLAGILEAEIIGLLGCELDVNIQ